MEKETRKKSGGFIIIDHYPNDGLKAKELMEKEIYGKIISKLR